MPAASVRGRSLSLVSRGDGQPTLEDTLRAEIEQVSSGRYLRRGTTAVYVADALTGKPIVAMHETERLNPASNVKLISTATALSILGPGWRYLTRVLGPMPSPEGVVSGDIYLLGSFDPTLGTGHLQRMATDMADAGITRIDGSIRVGTNDERDGIDRPHLKIHVTGTEPGAAPRIDLSPDNALARVEVKARTVKGKAGKRGQRARIRIKTELVTGEDTGPYYRVEVLGKISAGTRATYRRSISRGSLFGAHVLHAALGRAGITVTDPVRVRESELDVYMAQTRSFLPIELARHESLPLRELIARINKRSLNHLADRVVMSAGAALYGGPPTMAKAVRAMDEWLDEQAGIEPDGLVVDTGSGLSYKTQLTAQQIARVLRTAGGFISGNADPAQSELFEVFRDSLAVAGIDGTLRHRFRRSDAHGKVIGKTGTLTRVIALSGIVAESEQAMIFSIITNGHEHRRRSSVRKQHELIVEAVQRYLRRKMGNTVPADISDVAEFASAHGQGGIPGEDAEDDRSGGEDGVGIGTGGAGIGAVDISGISIGAAIGDLGIGSISRAIDGATALTAP